MLLNKFQRLIPYVDKVSGVRLSGLRH